MSTNGNDFAKYLLPVEVEEVTLPSGMVAKLRHPTLNYYLGRGLLPGRLAAVSQGTEGDVTSPDAGEMSNSTLLLLCDVFVEPRFTIHDPAESGSYPISRLRISDATKVLTWATEKMNASYKGGGGGTDLETFRKESGDGGDNGGGSQAVGSTPVVLPPVAATPAS